MFPMLPWERLCSPAPQDWAHSAPRCNIQLVSRDSAVPSPQQPHKPTQQHTNIAYTQRGRSDGAVWRGLYGVASMSPCVGVSMSTCVCLCQQISPQIYEKFIPHYFTLSMASPAGRDIGGTGAGMGRGADSNGVRFEMTQLNCRHCVSCGRAWLARCVFIPSRLLPLSLSV